MQERSEGALTTSDSFEWQKIIAFPLEAHENARV